MVAEGTVVDQRRRLWLLILIRTDEPVLNHFFWVKSHFSHLEEHVSEASSQDSELVHQRKVGGGCSATHIRPRRVAAGMAESLPSQPGGASDSPRNPPGR